MDYREKLRLWNARPFEFDSSRQLFLVGTSWVEARGFDVRMLAGIEATVGSDTPPIAIGNVGRLFLLPSGMNRLKCLSRSALHELGDAVIKSMVGVYGSFEGAREDLKEDPLFGFSFSFTRPGHPQVSVEGDCACLGTDASALVFKEGDWKNGYAEFSFHNAPDFRQRTALHAGIGAVAAYINRDR